MISITCTNVSQTFCLFYVFKGYRKGILAWAVLSELANISKWCMRHKKLLIKHNVSVSGLKVAPDKYLKFKRLLFF